MSYQKKDGRGHAHLSFFWYDNDSGHYCYVVSKKETHTGILKNLDVLWSGR